MNKTNASIYTGTTAMNDSGSKHQVDLSRKRRILRMAWVLAFFLSLVGGLTHSLLIDRTTWVDARGFLHEPLFWLVPVSYFFLFLAIALAVFDVAQKFRKERF